MIHAALYVSSSYLAFLNYDLLGTYMLLHFICALSCVCSAVMLISQALLHTFHSDWF